MSPIIVNTIFLLAIRDIGQGPGASLLQMFCICLQPCCLSHAKLCRIWSVLRGNHMRISSFLVLAEPSVYWQSLSLSFCGRECHSIYYITTLCNCCVFTPLRLKSKSNKGLKNAPCQKGAIWTVKAWSYDAYFHGESCRFCSTCLCE